jgi:hypothetical protein
MIQSKGITQQNLHGTFRLPHIVVAKLERQMKKNKSSHGSSENGRGVKQAASSGGGSYAQCGSSAPGSINMEQNFP